METKIFDGRLEAQKIKEKIKAQFPAEAGPRFGGGTNSLAVVLVGENPASLAYIKQKRKACQEVGLGFELIQFPATSSFEGIQRRLLILNSQLSISGIILQLPLPPHLSAQTDELTNSISPEKDVDGLTAHSRFTPPTALAVLHVLRQSKVKIEGARALVLGRGRTAGAPVARALRENGASVSVAHSQTPPKELRSLLLNADIVVSCVGQPNLIKGEMIKEGATVVGVGISQLLINNYQLKIHGDLDEASLMGRAALITPTPGGLGPLTVAFLFQNLLMAAKSQK